MGCFIACCGAAPLHVTREAEAGQENSWDVFK